LLAGPADSLVAPVFVTPRSNLVFQLDKQNRAEPWLRVTTAGSNHFTLKARRIGRPGLEGLTSRESRLPADPLPWSAIGRIDEVVTRAKSFGLLGGIVLGLSGAGLGNALGAPSHQGGAYALAGLGVFGAAGGFLGSRYGERFPHERNWYIGETLNAPAELPPAAAEPTISGPGGSGIVTSEAALRTARRIQPDRVIRVSHLLGRFQGFAGVAGPDGLEQLRLAERAPREWKVGAPPERIPWESIDEIRMRGGSGIHGALFGAGTFAAVGALFGAALVATLSGGEVTVAEGALAGAAIAAPVGLALGAGTGSMVRRWVVVYRRP
jgi:hypothetical protein